MFKNFDHFKKSTLSLFEASKSQKLNLSQFRENFSKFLGFENMEALKVKFENQEVELQNVVSVIYYVNGSINSKKDFIDNQEGNKKAEELFISLISEISEDKDFEFHIENGYFDTSYDDSKIFIVHSF